MSDKPSLYVVEKKEVIILVVLFVLVTVLSFTLGVRYGESVGKKTALDQAEARRELGEAGAVGGTGTLGKEDDTHGDAKGDTAKGGEHAAGHGDAKGEHGENHAEAKTAEGGHDKAGSHSAASPEGAAKASSGQGNEAVDKNSDEYLLNALKEAGVEPPGGKAPSGAKLPDDVKPSPSRPKIPGGSYVIQVGSHPTRGEAESQVRALKSKRVSAEILPPFKDKQGEWHRVVVGSYRSKRDADKEAAGLKGKGSIVSFFVWRLP